MQVAGSKSIAEAGVNRGSAATPGIGEEEVTSVGGGGEVRERPGDEPPPAALPPSTATGDGSGTDGTTNGAAGVTCRRCGWSGAASGSGKGQCPRCGVFLPANTGALKHGVKRLLEYGAGSPTDAARRAAIEAAVLADLGGRHEVSEVVAALAADFGFAVVLRDLAAAHLAAVGPFTKTGKRRAAVDLYLQCSQRAERLAAQLGHDRRPRRVPTLHEALAAVELPVPAAAAGRNPPPGPSTCDPAPPAGAARDSSHPAGNSTDTVSDRGRS